MIGELVLKLDLAAIRSRFASVDLLVRDEISLELQL